LTLVYGYGIATRKLADYWTVRARALVKGVGIYVHLLACGVSGRGGFFKRRCYVA
jgi:hypothetical protein